LIENGKQKTTYKHQKEVKSGLEKREILTTNKKLKSRYNFDNKIWQVRKM